MALPQKQQIELIKSQALKDNSLPFSKTATNLVIGDGNPNANIFFLGEAPGKFEDLKGLPFIGQAGKILDKLLASIQLKRADVFITSVLWYRPPKNRDPKLNEIDSFKPYLDQLIKVINPKIIVTLGRFSLNKFLPGAKISEVHGKAQKAKLNGREVTIIPTYHPAAALYKRSMLDLLLQDFQQIAQTLKRGSK